MTTAFTEEMPWHHADEYEITPKGERYFRYLQILGPSSYQQFSVLSDIRDGITRAHWSQRTADILEEEGIIRLRR